MSKSIVRRSRLQGGKPKKTEPPLKRIIATIESGEIDRVLEEIVAKMRSKLIGKRPST